MASATDQIRPSWLDVSRRCGTAVCGGLAMNAKTYEIRVRGRLPDDLVQELEYVTGRQTHRDAAPGPDPGPARALWDPRPASERRDRTHRDSASRGRARRWLSHCRL